jgi:hypothetical protein
MEAAMAALAIAASIGGGLYTTVYHSGASATQITQLTQHDIDQDKKIDDHDTRIRAQETNASAEQQSLKDIKEQLDRMEKKL